MNKYTAMRRSQIVMGLYHLETKLLLWKASDPRRPAVEAERKELFAALRIKDDELTAKWEAAHPYTPVMRTLESCSRPLTPPKR
jgi:hypothetical protein